MFSSLIKLNFKKLSKISRLKIPFTIPELFFSKKTLVDMSSPGTFKTKLFLFFNLLSNFKITLLPKKFPFILKKEEFSLLDAFISASLISKKIFFFR